MTSHAIILLMNNPYHSVLDELLNEINTLENDVRVRATYFDFFFCKSGSWVFSTVITVSRFSYLLYSYGNGKLYKKLRIFYEIPFYFYLEIYRFVSTFLKQKVHVSMKNCTIPFKMWFWMIKVDFFFITNLNFKTNLIFFN